MYFVKCIAVHPSRINNRGQKSYHFPRDLIRFVYIQYVSYSRQIMITIIYPNKDNNYKFFTDIGFFKVKL